MTQDIDHLTQGDGILYSGIYLHFVSKKITAKKGLSSVYTEFYLKLGQICMDKNLKNSAIQTLSIVIIIIITYSYTCL